MADDKGASGGGDEVPKDPKVAGKVDKTPSISVESLPLSPNSALQTHQQTAQGSSTGTLPKHKDKTSRSTSPLTRSQVASRLLTPLEVGLKADTQILRLNELTEIQQLIQDSAQWSLDLVEEVRSQVDDLTRLIAADGEMLQLMWTQEVSDHTYFKEKAYAKAIKLGYKLRRDLATLKGTLAPPPAPMTAQAHSSRLDTKLPDISLPHFSGTYSEWPYFRDMFESMILHHEGLTPVQKLHYLRNCLSDEPAQIVSSFEVRDSSFEPAWKALTSRFDNKRLAIQSHLDKLLNLTPLNQRTSEGLNRIARVSADVKRGLEALNVADRLGDMLLVHLTVRNLDRATREAWETSLGSSQEFPTSAQAEQFIQAKARALERIEQPSTKSHHAQHPATSKGSGPRRSAHTAAKTAQPSSQTASAQQSAQASQKQQQTSASAQPSKTSSFAAGPTAHACDYCQETHYVVACPHFRKLPVHMRMDFVETKKLCYNCLGRHSVRSCKSAHRCKTCNAQHHTMLHGYKPALAHVCNHINAQPVRLLIDSGSELSFITESLIRQLNLPRQSSSLTITGIGGSKSTQTLGLVQITLCSRHSQETATIEAHILRAVTSIVPSSKVTVLNWPHLQDLALADEEYFKPRPVDIIIGADFYGTIIKHGLIKAHPGAPIAQSSIFGWLILGPANATFIGQASAHHGAVQHDEELYDLLSRFWTQEEPPSDSDPSMTAEEEECEQHFLTTHSRDATGRYVVRIPLKESPSVLGSSYTTASRCLQRLSRRLAQDSEFSQLYRDFMREYEALGHMKRVDPSEESHQDFPPFYLPHHGVLKPDSSSTKLRVVFNGSSSTSSGKSVNSIMYTGKNLLLNIVHVLLWIRLFRQLFGTDIVKMYRQVKVHPEDWNLQRILWLDEQLREIIVYLTTVTYGTKAAPFLATRALLQLVADEGHRFPLAVPPLKKGRYVDDIFGGADTIQQLIKIAQQVKALCNAGGFPLSKWHATHPDLLTAVSSDSSSTPISLDDCETKLLGLQWNPQSDTFTFKSHFKPHSGHLTKRIILSEIAQVFDPLGFASPVIINAKILMQELWLLKLTWDDPLPQSVCSRWLKLREELSMLASISIPRWLGTWSFSTVQLHGFSDASQDAMAAVIYLVVNSPSTGTTTSFVCSKTKVAPLKKLTIPRLELTAALLLVKLIDQVTQSLQVNIDSIHLWTDSQVALTWINSDADRWKDYVRNRVSQIKKLCTPNTSWRHVPGIENPADCGSRGISTAQLNDHALWWHGPQWITFSQNHWPAQLSVSSPQADHEAKPSTSLVAVVKEPTYHWDLILKYSSLNKLLNITALCFRVRDQLKFKIKSKAAQSMAQYVRMALEFWIKATQSAYFSSEVQTLSHGSTLPSGHVFSRLTAFIDAKGIVRVGGRLHQSTLSYEEKHPAILPRQSPLTSLLIDSAHRVTLHGGTQLTLAKLRQTCWIIGGRASVKAHITRCVPCARQRGRRAQQLMGQLPVSRLTPSRPFLYTGVDYAGPMTMKTWKGRGCKTQKGWICVFVCMVSSAAHLEVVSDYSADGFIAAYRRFVSRRGLVLHMYSDCGTTFQGAQTELKRLFNQSSQDHQNISATLAAQGTSWHFNPPASPHMGGKWEALVKSIKFHLRRTLGETLLTFEELTTLLTQIEAVLNSRPLEPLSDDPNDVSALTPGHFLIGSALNSVPEPSLLEIPTARLARWQLIQQKMQSFWRQWSAHYLQRQQTISKWHHPSNELEVGKLVLLTDERTPPSRWPLGRIIHIHPESDEHSRVFTIKTATTTLIRPGVKLAPLPVPLIQDS